jgi:tripartite-type tricarboxylate transporter receptor subunit TctC
VPYKSGGALTTALIANESQFAVTPLPAALPHIMSGRLRVLGVGSSRRSAKLPEVPTIAEAGVSGYQSTGWAGLLAPRGVAQSIVHKLNASVREAMSRPEMREQIERQGADAVASTPAEFAILIRDDWERFGRAIKAARLGVE